MSFEKLPTAPVEKQEPKQLEEGPKAVPEAKKEEGSREKTRENVVRIADYLNLDNRGFFKRMSDAGREMAGEAYKKLYEMPGVNKAVGRMEIAYGQFWINRHEKKNVGLKNKMDGIDLKIQAFQQSKQEIESIIKDMQEQGMSGVASLQLKLKDLDRQSAGLLNKRDKIQSKFEARENKVKLYTNERDRIADGLIEQYNEKIKPLEEKLENLRTSKDQADLNSTVMEVKHKELSAELEKKEEEKKRIEETLRRTGMSEREIRNFEVVKIMGQFIAKGHERIRTEQEAVFREEAGINKKIAKIDAKANPYRDKRERFLRVKESRPLELSVEDRKRGTEFKTEESTDAHTRTREEGPRAFYIDRNPVEDVETTAENRERSKISSYVSLWNTYLREQYKGKVPNDSIDVKDFSKATKLSADYELDFKDFGAILARYYKFRKLPIDMFNKNIEGFRKEKIENKS